MENHGEFSSVSVGPMPNQTANLQNEGVEATGTDPCEEIVSGQTSTERKPNIMFRSTSGPSQWPSVSSNSVLTNTRPSTNLHASPLDQGGTSNGCTNSHPVIEGSSRSSVTSSGHCLGHCPGGTSTLLRRPLQFASETKPEDKTAKKKSSTTTSRADEGHKSPSSSMSESGPTSVGPPIHPGEAPESEGKRPHKIHKKKRFAIKNDNKKSMDKIASFWAKLRISPKNVILREFLAEAVGTFLLVFIGDGAVAQAVFFVSSTFFAINWGYALAVAFGAMVSAKISGGHINPAVSTTMVLLGRMEWTKLLWYIPAQYCGAFFGACLVAAFYADRQSSLDLKDSETMGIYATYPSTGVSVGAGIADQFIGTALLLFLIMTIADPRHGIPPFGVALLAGTAVLSIGISFGKQTGYAINPARDFGPR